MKKLISMTDFILEQRMTSEEVNASSFQQIQNHINTYYDKVYAYANFLKQPLKLEMFVPCDEDENVLEEPKNFLVDFENEFNSVHRNKVCLAWYNECKQYQKATKKVLFEGFKIYDYKLNVFFYLGKRKTLSYDKKRKDFITIGFLPETIEDLLSFSKEIELTESAIKQINN